MFVFFLAVLIIALGFVVSYVLTMKKLAIHERWVKVKSENERTNGRYGSDPGEEPDTKKVILPVIISVVLSVVFIVAGCVAVVPTGYTGIRQKVVKMDNRTQKVQIETSAFSSDIQQVDLDLSVNYCIDQETAQNLYRTVGTSYYENVMFPRIQENTKAVFSQYSAENLIAKRDMLSDAIQESTAIDMKPYGITIVSVAIEDIDFTDAFTNAVEAKQVAAQNKLTAETEQAQKTMEEEQTAKRSIIAANAEAEKSIIAANADLEVVKVQAEAALYAGEKEAEMNKRISESLAGDIIDYYWIKQWDGHLPTTVLGEGGNYMLDLGTLGEEG